RGHRRLAGGEGGDRAAHGLSAGDCAVAIRGPCPLEGDLRRDGVGDGDVLCVGGTVVGGGDGISDDRPRGRRDRLVRLCRGNVGLPGDEGLGGRRVIARERLGRR